MYPSLFRNCDTNIAETSDEWATVSVCHFLTSVQELKCEMYYVTGSGYCVFILSRVLFGEYNFGCFVFPYLSRTL
jgi:hypothetical protein